MTTPAVSLNAYGQPVEQRTWRTDCNGNPYGQTVTYPNSKHIVDVRPASTNSPRDRRGWRNPTGWSHRKFWANILAAGSLNGSTPVGCGAGKKQTWVAENYFSWAGTIDIDPPSCPQWLIDTATTKAYLALKNQKVNFSVAFAEYQETADLVANTVRRITRGVKAYRNSRPKDWAKVTKNGLAAEGWKVPQSWLELQYGWNPLMSDVEGACKELSDRDRHSGKPHAHVVGKSSYDEFSYIDKDSGFLANGLFGQRLTVHNRYDVTIRLWYDLNCPLLALFSSLGLTNPAELIWEKVRYSFVVDWFIPIGNWLSTMDADFGWLYKTGARSLFTHTQKTSVPTIPHPDVGIYHADANFTSPCKYDGVRSERTVLGVPPGVGLPHFKNPFSAKHLANALSLLAQAFH